MMKCITKISLAVALGFVPGISSSQAAPDTTRNFSTYENDFIAVVTYLQTTGIPNCGNKMNARLVYQSSAGDQTLVFVDGNGDCKLSQIEKVVSYEIVSSSEDVQGITFSRNKLESIQIKVAGNEILTCSSTAPECTTAAERTKAKNFLNPSTTDPCSISNSLSNQKKYGCKNAKQVNDFADAGTTIIGTVTTQMIQAKTTQKTAELANATNAGDANRVAADLSQTTANQQKTMAGVRGIAATIQAAQMKKYQKNANAIDQLIKSGNVDQASVLGVIPVGAEKYYNDLSSDDKKAYLNRVKAEQLSAKDTAKSGLFTSLATVAASTASAMNADKIARDQNAYADKMDSIARQQQALLELSQVQVTPAAVATFAPYTYNNTTNVNNGATDNPNGTTSDEPEITDGGSGIQGPAMDGSTPNEVATLPYGAMKPGAGGEKPAAAGGGGGGSAGAGGGSPQLGQDDRGGGSTLVMNGKSENYDSIGKSKNGMGGAAGASANAGGGDGLDLNSMLAKFLPGGGGTDEEANNGILDYAKREPSRAPANEAQVEEMILDRGADLFQRVSATYRDKLEKKEVGI